MGKQLIDKTSQRWKQHGCTSPALVSAEGKVSEVLVMMRKSAFVVLLGKLLVSLWTPKKTGANNFVALRLNQTGRNLSGPMTDQGRRYLVSGFPAYVWLFKIMRLLCLLGRKHSLYKQKLSSELSVFPSSHRFLCLMKADVAWGRVSTETHCSAWKQEGQCWGGVLEQGVKWE